MIDVSALVWIMVTHDVNMRAHLKASTLSHILFKLSAAQLL